MEPIFQPDNEPELIVFLSILINEEIPYFVHNYHFGSLFPGLQVPLYNTRKVMVPEKFVSKANKLLGGYLKSIEREPLSKRLPIFDKIRIVLEVIVCSWAVLGSKKMSFE